MWYEYVFYACNYGVVPAWALLVFAPRWRWTDRLVSSALIPLLFGVAYATVLFTDRSGNPEGSFFSFEGVVAIFDSPQTIVAGWIHYLIFDLFCGAWQVRDARRLGIPHLAAAPFLLLTLMFGPVGLLGYCVLRAVTKKRFLFEEVGDER